MKKSILAIFILMNSIAYGQLKGKVTSVIDGSSFTLFTNDHKELKIKLYGIDTPKEEQAYGSKAKLTLMSYISNQDVDIEVKNSKGKGGYTIGIVTINDIVVNEAMLLDGMAWHNTKEDKSEKYAKLEQEAKKKSTGLWSGYTPH